MITLLRVESWDGSRYVGAKVVPNRNVAKVYVAQQEALGFRTLLCHTRTETERAA